MARKSRHLRNWTEAGLVHLVFALLGLLPRRARLSAGKRLGLCLHALSSRHRRMARANLDRALGSSVSSAEKDRIARASFAHLGLLLCDSLAFSRVGPGRLEKFGA